MKANEFVKKFGLEKAKNITVFSLGFEGDCSDFNFTIGDLKRLVESHELVETAGGIKTAKLLVVSANKLTNALQQQKANVNVAVPETISSLEKAIADVESCQVEGE